MSKKLRAPTQLTQTVMMPAGITLALALALSSVGPAAALSALTGGMIVVVANAYSTWRVFGAAQQETGQQVLANMYRAEVGKLLMMGALFIAVFAGWKNVDIAAFIAGSAAVILTVPIASAFRDVNQNNSRERETDTKTDG